MVRQRSKLLYSLLVVLFLLSFSVLFAQFESPVVAEEVDAAQVQVETPEPTQPPPTQPPPTNTPTEEPTQPPEPTLPPPTPLPPAEIPEPITVILFGTGLAALSAAAARRKKAE